MGYRGPTQERPPTKTQMEVLRKVDSGWRLRSSGAVLGRESFWLAAANGKIVWVNGKTHLGLRLRRLVDIDLSDDTITKWMLTARGREALKKG